MDKQYKNLMVQQNIGTEITARFYEKLEQTTTQRKSMRWKAALAVVCIALTIPLTVLAVENIFGVPKMKFGKLDWHESPNGYSIRFENLKSFPLKTFPKELQSLAEYKVVPYDSWEIVEDTLGIDLLNNTFLANAEKITMRYDDLGYIHSKITYSPYEGQLYYMNAAAYYKYENVQLDLKAKITIEHPAMDEETRQALLGIEGVITKPVDADISYETYTTKVGIPVVILRCDYKMKVINYTAVFAVNNISYEITAWVDPNAEDAGRQILLDVLDNFNLK